VTRTEELFLTIPGFFSAIFVQLVFYQYPPFSNHVADFPTKMIISTLITRIVAVTEGAIVGVFVNFIISSPFVGRIFKYRLYYAEKIAWNNFSQFLNDNVEFQSQQAFFMMTDLLKVTMCYLYINVVRICVKLKEI
jgi:hypothetical protein